LKITNRLFAGLMVFSAASARAQAEDTGWQHSDSLWILTTPEAAASKSNGKALTGKSAAQSE